MRLWHQHDLTSFTGHPKIGYTVFELEKFGERELHSLNYPDLIVTCSEWGRNLRLSQGIDAKTVPLGYDETIFKPCDFEQRDNTVFANFGKWEIRKGHDVLIRAFNAAFDPKDEVTLIMMPTNGFIGSERSRVWEKMYLGSKMGDRIQIVPRVANHSEVYNIMSQVDCGVFPARAEGWNLEALEMLGCGKHLIISNCTGHTEFVNDKNSRLIDMPEEFESAYDGIFFDGSSSWRKFTNDSFDSLVSELRDFHKKRFDKSANHAGVEDASQFTWSKSTEKLSNVLKEFVC